MFTENINGATNVGYENVTLSNYKMAQPQVTFSLEKLDSLGVDELFALFSYD